MAQIGDLFNTNWIAVFRFLLPSERRQLAAAEYYIAFRLTRVLAEQFVLVPYYILPEFPPSIPFVVEPEPEPGVLQIAAQLEPFP